MLFELLSNSGEDFTGVWLGGDPWTRLPSLSPPLPTPEGAHRRHLRAAGTSDHLGLAQHTLLAGGLKRLAARLAQERDGCVLARTLLVEFWWWSRLDVRCPYRDVEKARAACVQSLGITMGRV